MSAPSPEFNAKIIEEFRANGGRVEGSFAGRSLLLLHHTGRRSGEERVNPLAYIPDGERYVVFASNGGEPTNPGWYDNLKVNPATTIEVGAQRLGVVASEAAGEERDRLFRAQIEKVPHFATYEQQAGRVIPVLILTPTAES